jgi:hypothetical protein
VEGYEPDGDNTRVADQCLIDAQAHSIPNITVAFS